MNDPNIVFWYFDQYVNVIRMLSEGPLDDLIREGIDEETLHGLYLGIVQLGFRIKWQLIFFVTPEEREGKKEVCARIALFRIEESQTAPLRTHEVRLFLLPDSYARLEREALQKNHRKKEGNLITPEENDRFIESLGLNPPPH